MRELREQGMGVPDAGRSARTRSERGPVATACASSILGTPADAVPPLRALVAAGHDVAFVVTQPDRRRSRGAGADPSPVKRGRGRARARGAHAREGARGRRRRARESGAELGVVVAFGQLLPVALLDALPHGFVNLHFSLLPRWRGAAPVERAILAGDAETGVCLMQLEAGSTPAGVSRRARVAIGATETAGELRARLVDVGHRAARRAPARGARRASPSRRSGEPTYADKLTVEEFRARSRRAPRPSSTGSCARATRVPARGCASAAGA